MTTSFSDRPGQPLPRSRGRWRPTRRQFLGAAAAAGLTAAGYAGWRARTPAKRNVIVIISDSMRRDALGCYGTAWVETPNLNDFAAQGVRFDNAYTCSFPTVPARHDILTGTYTCTYKSWSPLAPGTLSLQDLLRGAGVHTALIADTPTPYADNLSYHRGFAVAQRVRGQENDRYVTDPIPVHLPCDPGKLRTPEDYVTQYLRNVSRRKGEEDYFCARTMRQAVRWLEESHGRQPFFLCVDTFDPHEPWDPPRHYVEGYDPDFRGQDVIAPRYGRWRRVLTPDELRHCRALYAAEASLVDRWVGELLDTADELGLLENTLIVFLSDHGVLLGEHGLVGKGLTQSGRIFNVPLYPELCRIPLLAYYPGCKAGAALPALVQTVNLPATIADYLGVPVPDSFAAPSFWPVLRGDEPELMGMALCAPTLSSPRHKVPDPTDRATITDGRWMLMYSCASPDREPAGGPSGSRVSSLTGMPLGPALFDLSADPDCLRDVFAEHRDVARHMHRRFFDFLSWSPMRREHLAYFKELEPA